MKSPQKHFSFLFFQANPQPNFMELQHGKMLFRSFFQIRYGYTPSYMFTFLSPCVYWLLCPVGKAGLVSCLEFTFSISLMVVVAWKSIVLCAEPTKICSRHCGMFHFGGGAPTEKKALVYWELTVANLCYLRGQVSCLDDGGREGGCLELATKKGGTPEVCNAHLGETQIASDVTGPDILRGIVLPMSLFQGFWKLANVRNLLAYKTFFHRKKVNGKDPQINADVTCL